MLDKINIWPIIKDHIYTLRNYGTGKRSLPDLVLFFALPLILSAAALWWKGVLLRTSAVNGLLTAFSIFIGLLLNLVVMVLTFLQTTKGDATDRFLQARKQLLREITTNLSFSILISVALVAVAILALVSGMGKDEDPVSPVATFLLIAGSASFVLNLLMILRRMYTLLLNEFDRHKLDRAA